MEGIRVYFEPSGRAVVDLPCGVDPDRNTLERISDMIRSRGGDVLAAEISAGSGVY